MVEKDNLFAVCAYPEYGTPTAAVARSLTGQHLDYVADIGDLKESLLACMGWAQGVAEKTIFAPRDMLDLLDNPEGFSAALVREEWPA
jgi:hypothetical protein